MAQTTVSKTTYEKDNGDEQEQYRTTIPKGIAEAMQLEGSTLEWTVDSQNTLKVTRVDDD